MLLAKEYSPRKIETYAYTLLSLLQRNDENSLAEGTQLVHWLTSKMNPRGGFMSTQVRYFFFKVRYFTESCRIQLLHWMPSRNMQPELGQNPRFRFT